MLCSALYAQEPSFTWLLDKAYCDSVDCFQERAMEKDFVYSEISQTDESTSWFFTANSWSRITSSKKSLESQNRLLYKLSTDGSVTIVLATEDGTYNERLVKEIEDKGFKEHP